MNESPAEEVKCKEQHRAFAKTALLGLGPRDLRLLGAFCCQLIYQNYQLNRDKHNNNDALFIDKTIKWQ